jgi:hypothetical protein
MTRTIRIGARTLAAALTAAALAVAAPAEAHPVAHLNCESGEGTFICGVGISHSAGPQTIRWTINNQAAPGHNCKIDAIMGAGRDQGGGFTRVNAGQRGFHAGPRAETAVKPP